MDLLNRKGALLVVKGIKHSGRAQKNANL